MKAADSFSGVVSLFPVFPILNSPSPFAAAWRQIRLYKAGTREIKWDVMEYLVYIVRYVLLPEGLHCNP